MKKYNAKITDRVREALADLPGVEEKEMFGGVCFGKWQNMHLRKRQRNALPYMICENGVSVRKCLHTSNDNE